MSCPPLGNFPELTTVMKVESPQQIGFEAGKQAENNYKIYPRFPNKTAYRPN